MNLKQIQYFIAVAEELHFGRAAERLDMAQPPLSRQIKAMEEDLEAALFNRGRTGVTLTQAGERLYEHAIKIIKQIDDARLEVRRIGQGAEGRLRIGFVGSATFGILPNIIKSFRAHYGEVNLGLEPMNNAQLHRALIRREIDIALARPTLNDPDFISRKLMEEELILAAPDILAAAHNGSVKLDDLEDENFILYPEHPRPSFADFVIAEAKAQGLSLKKRVFTMDLQTALSLVAIGEGVCIVPGSVATASRMGVKFLKLQPHLGSTAVSLNYRADEQGIHVHNFVQLAQVVARKMD